jgi:hypothetical protein
MPPVGFEPTIAAGERPLGPAQVMITEIKFLSGGHLFVLRREFKI